MTPLSLRIARLLLVGAAAAALMSAVYIAAQSSEPARAWPFLAFFLMSGAAFVRSATWLIPRPTRARWLAFGAALTLAGLGIASGFGAGNVTIPAAGLGVIAAWSTRLHPPRTPWVLAFVAYVAIGVAASLPMADVIAAQLWTLAWILLWPWFVIARLGEAAFPATLGLIAVGIVFVTLAYVVPRRAAGTP